MAPGDLTMPAYAPSKTNARWLASVWLAIAAVGCERESKPNATAASKPATAVATGAPSPPNTPQAAPKAPPVPPKLELHGRREGDHLQLSIENHDGRDVSVPMTATLSGAAGTDPLTVDLTGTCGAHKPDTCRSLAPGAALWLSPLSHRKPDGTCQPVPTGQYQIQLTECPDGAPITGRIPEG